MAYDEQTPYNEQTERDIIDRAYELVDQYRDEYDERGLYGYVGDFMYARAYNEITGEHFDMDSLCGFTSHISKYVVNYDQLVPGVAVLWAEQLGKKVIFTVFARTNLADNKNLVTGGIRRMEFFGWRTGTYWAGDFRPLITRAAFDNTFVDDLYDPRISDWAFGEKYKRTFAVLCKDGCASYLPCWNLEVEGCKDPTDGEWDDWMDANDDEYGYTPGWRE